jgi:mono/diheme cytochrome c family protein
MSLVPMSPAASTMSRSLTALLPFALLFPVACGEAGRIDTILDLTGDVESGGNVYAANRAGRHGVDATGGTEEGILGESAEETVDIVLNGEDSMPSFADTLEDQEIADLLAWLAAQG